MNETIMIELKEDSDALAQIQGFQWDATYGVVQLSNGRFLYRGILQTEEAKQNIRKLPCFLSLLADSSIAPCNIPFEQPNFVIKRIDESATKKELECFLTFAEQKGKNVALYRKWVEKMTDNKRLPLPVYGKMINELGIEYNEPKG